VADPGAALVKLAQEHDIEVVPLVGPSSLMMALMSSGMNGQNFAFNGYLPVKPQQRKESLRKLEKLSAQTGQTQIIIETPYRNDAMLADMLEVLKPATRICIAADITMPTQFIRTKTAAQWKKAPAAIGKRPCVFIISA
jgi:16S rRNA (cytidine1402-2'-O)-methyltransferase